MNIVDNWTTDTPTEPGLYLVHYAGTARPITLHECGGILRTEEGLHPESYAPGCLWARLVGSLPEGST